MASIIQNWKDDDGYMKFFSICTIAVLSLALQASASVYSVTYNSGFGNNGFIPDGNTNGWTDTREINEGSLTGRTITDVQVTLNISGGWNGDLYGYLVHDSGFALLLNQVGKTESDPYGFSNSGFTSVVLNDTTGSVNIQTIGSYSSTAAISGGPYLSAGTVLDTAFDGKSVNGSWTLFLADLHSGDVSQLNSWSLAITSVPEPSTWAMIGFGVIFGGWQFAKRRMAR